MTLKQQQYPCLSTRGPSLHPTCYHFFKPSCDTKVCQSTSDQLFTEHEFDASLHPTLILCDNEGFSLLNLQNGSNKHLCQPVSLHDISLEDVMVIRWICGDSLWSVVNRKGFKSNIASSTCTAFVLWVKVWPQFLSLTKSIIQLLSVNFTASEDVFLK